LLFEKAIAKYNIDSENSWMIGDRERDMIPAQKLGIQTLQISHPEEKIVANHEAGNLWEAAQIIEGIPRIN